MLKVGDLVKCIQTDQDGVIEEIFVADHCFYHEDGRSGKGDTVYKVRFARHSWAHRWEYDLLPSFDALDEAP